jgi:hypothetical protein
MWFQNGTFETHTTIRICRSEFLSGKFRHFGCELTQKDVTYREVIVGMTVWNLGVTLVLWRPLDTLGNLMSLFRADEISDNLVKSSH